MESDVEFGETAVLRGTVATVEAAHGEAPGLQVPAATEAHVYRRWQEDAHLRVQVTDAAAAARDATALVPGRWRRDELLVAGGRRSGRCAASSRCRSRPVGTAVGLAAGDDVERRRCRPELGPSVVLLPAGQSVADGHDELLAREFRLDRRLRRESATSRRGLNRSSGSATLAARSIIVVVVIIVSGQRGSSGRGRGSRGRGFHVAARSRALLVTRNLRSSLGVHPLRVPSELSRSCPRENARLQRNYAFGLITPLLGALVRRSVPKPRRRL